MGVSALTSFSNPCLIYNDLLNNGKVAYIYHIVPEGFKGFAGWERKRKPGFGVINWSDGRGGKDWNANGVLREWNWRGYMQNRKGVRNAGGKV